MTDFGLIHGGAHGAWCWDFVKPELEMRGHRVFTVDLPCEDVTKGAIASAQIAAEAFRSAESHLTLVAHSLGGLTAPLMPAFRPVRQVVFLCAVIPEIGRSMVEQSTEMELSYQENNSVAVSLDDIGRICYPPEKADEFLWPDCAPDVARWAGAQLRPQSTLIMAEVTPLAAWPKVAYHSIIATEDRVINRETHRIIVSQRLGITPLEIPGSHSPFLSRPGHLAAILDDISKD